MCQLPFRQYNISESSVTLLLVVLLFCILSIILFLLFCYHKLFVINSNVFPQFNMSILNSQLLSSLMSSSISYLLILGNESAEQQNEYYNEC